MSSTGSRLAKLEQAWLATQEHHSTPNGFSKAKGHYGQLAVQFAPLLIEDLKAALEKVAATDREYKVLLEANRRLALERDRMIQNALDAQHEIQRLKDVLARLTRPLQAR